MREDASIVEAKNVLKYQIKFLESLKKYISGPNLILKNNAMWTTCVLNRYMQQNMVDDVKRVMDERQAEDTTTATKEE